MKRGRMRPCVLLSVVGAALLVICVAGTALLAFFTWPKPNQEILGTVSDVCRGKGVEAAAAYAPGSGSHTIVLLDASGSRHAWTEMLPYNWRPKSISTAELVACIDKEQEELVDVCTRYSGGQTIRRYQYSMPIRLAAARSGKTIASGVVKGEPPRICRIAELVSTTEIHGAHVKAGEVEEWLRKFVAPE